MATLRERITSAGISEERAETMARQGWLRVDGEPVTDLDADAAPGARITAQPPGVTEHEMG